MQQVGFVTIYHVERRGGKSLFLHPFNRGQSTLSVLDSDTIRGRYGAEPRVEALTVLRNELYRRIETDVRDWVYEQRFVPRFLISAAAFVVTYLFLSLVIRDPIPFVDELVVSIIVSVVAFLTLGRRYERSSGAAERRADLRAKFDGITFEESEFVHAVEGALQELEAAPVDRLVAAPAPTPGVGDAIASHRDEAVGFLSVLGDHLSREEKRAVSGIKKGTLTARTRRLAERGDVDLPLAALHRLVEHVLG